MTERGFLIAGGGTGGHVFPALALAGEIRRRRPGAPVVFVGTARGLETALVPKAGFPLELVRAKGLVGKGWRARLEGLLSLPLAFVDSLRLLARHAPRAVVGVGGYASGPLVATAWARRVPTLIHEQNAVPGLTNRLLARVAKRVAVGTARAAAALPGAVVTGNPVREVFFGIPSLVSREKRRRLRVLVVGGSQGAQILNRLVPPALARVAAAGIAFDVVHQAGRGRTGEVVTSYARLGLAADRAFVHEFLDDMAAAYAAADLVVARAGAMTIAEIAAAGRPALLVPFAAATHAHQEANARALEAKGGAVVLTEADATDETLAAALAALLGDPLRLLEMGEAARRAALPDAASRLCDLLFEVEAA
ncbi:MAG TPA: undecaprenyldiphospho-muramoylpentapeptide beta-N-acetylglucosaminyltransferase [Thermoanaerobaculia bacterium]|nr:undecaprenyldiphospho-muramoylpentapeptide beta-N-acetylglucosaminyltransferase [Thermoanaerobaculia bacterium]